MSSVVRYSEHYNLILRTIQYYIPKTSLFHWYTTWRSQNESKERKQLRGIQ